MTSDSPKSQLVRALGRWTMVALVFNGTLGGGIFRLPANIAQLIGGAALWGYAIAGVAMVAIMAVMAELSSQFHAAGGPYLYARTAFGRFAGVQIGWFLWLMRLTAAGAVADVFVTYLGEFWPTVTTPLVRTAVLLGMFGGLATINYRGVRLGAAFSNLVTAAKLATLGLFIVVGFVLVRRGDAVAAPSSAHFGDWIDALVKLAYAYGGFEAALIPGGEMKNPRRDMPLALLGGLGVVAVCYLSVHYITMTALPDLAQHGARPLADAARVFAGPAAASLVAVGALLATGGWLAVQLLSAPRLTFALAERGDFPPVFARVHPRFRTPHVSIVVWAVIATALTISGSFIWNAELSVAARLVTWGAACAALIQLRRTQPTIDAWRAPLGIFAAGFGIVFCLVLLTRMTGLQTAIMAGIAVLATVNWFAVRARPDVTESNASPR